jgi:hypothetical protein
MSHDHLQDYPIDQMQSDRRGFLIAAAIAGSVAAPAYAQEPPRDASGTRDVDRSNGDILDGLRIADLV